MSIGLINLKVLTQIIELEKCIIRQGNQITLLFVKMTTNGT